MKDEFEGSPVFDLVETLSFRAARDRLGVTCLMARQDNGRRLEARLGVALLQQTMHSVRLTSFPVPLCKAEGSGPALGGATRLRSRVNRNPPAALRASPADHQGHRS